MSAGFDRRLTPARPDLAALALEGKVEAERFVAPVIRSSRVGIAPLRRNPHDEAELDDELLFGDRFDVYEELNGWAWGQAADGYVGYIPAQNLVAGHATPTHRVIALRSFVLRGPDYKLPPRDALPMNARVVVDGYEGRYARLSNGSYITAAHLAPLTDTASDFVAIAEQFIGAPYLWGGKTILGCDCSGLMQTALERCGIAAPRDTDMLEAALGKPIDRAELKRGDLVFWSGHLGVMRDRHTLLHANAYAMCVASEPLGEAIERIAAAGFPVTTFRRL